jgi:hypothetical protein
MSTPKKTGFRKTLPSLERLVHVVAERELNPKLRMEEEEENAGKFENTLRRIIKEVGNIYIHLKLEHEIVNLENSSFVL